MKHGLSLVLTSILASPAPGLPQEAPATALEHARAGETRELLRRYTTDRRALERFHPTPVSTTRLARLAAHDDAWRALLDAVPYDSLDASERVDWQLLAAQLARHAREDVDQRARRAALAPLLPFLDDVLALEDEHRTGRERPAAEEAERMARLARDVGAAREACAELEISPVLAQRAARALDSLDSVLGAWFRDHDAFEPDFAWWVTVPHGAAQEALEGYAEHLREELAGLEGEDDDPLVGDPLGREALEHAIAAELLAYTPEELLAIGDAEFAWCEARMAEAARELGHDDWRVALDAVKQEGVPPGEQDTLVARQARAAIAFLDERELVTIEPLARETWRVEMLPAERQRVLPFAAYGGQKVVVAYPTRDMDHERKRMSLRGNGEHFTRIVTPHELIPGHHLQAYMAERYATWRRGFRTPFLVEGWALHWEMLLWDEGWARGAQDRIGMLLWRMHRCARILVSLRFHLGEMTPDEMIDFLVQRVGLERDGATAEVRRYVGPDYGPLYQCAYMIGGLALRALHGELVGGGRMTQREFHDAVLRQGAIPIELIRAALLQRELPRTWAPDWRFAD